MLQENAPGKKSDYCGPNRLGGIGFRRAERMACHMQVQEGDIIATIRKGIEYIGHFHTAGVPGRHELDEDQEIYYPAVMRAIVETGYDGYVAHEYSPRRDPLTSLKEAVKLCDV